MLGRQVDEENARELEQEQQCLVALARILIDERAIERMRVPAGRLFRGVALSGFYPDTRVVITYIDAGTKEEGEMNFGLWSDREFGSDLHREGPDGMATLIYAHAIER
jgi:hypothetical protein